MQTSILPLLISATDFADKMQSELAGKDIRIVDLSSEGNYLAGHIPGAIHLPYQALVLGQPPAPGKLPGEQRLLEIINFLGINKDTHVIAVDDEGGGWAGRFIWTLDVIGHQHYSYIDGGMLAWKQAGLELETQPNQVQAAEVSSITINNTPRALLDDIVNELNQNTFIVWDARSPEEYQGTKVLSAKGGHIPGAVNAEWTSLMDPSQGYIIRKDAQAYLEKLGIDGSKPIITHCQSHHRSGFTYLIGKVLGFEIKGYDGSWSEWGNHPDTPVETV